jgi:hypothetical protein
VAYILDIVKRTAAVGESSKALSQATAVVKAFLDQGETGKHGLMQTRALTRAVQYARENDRMESVQIWDPQRAQKENNDSV